MTLRERGQVREQIVALKDHADPRPLAGELRGLSRRRRRSPAAAIAEQLAVEADLAALEILQKIDAAEQRRLARAARADDRHDVGREDVEIDAAKDRVRAEDLGQAPDGEDRFQACAPTGSESGVRATQPPVPMVRLMRR